MTNPYQPLDPQTAPDPVTPQASPSDPAGYASVTPSGQGPSWYNIEAPLDDLTAEVQGARELSGGGEGATNGPGIPDIMSPRQAQTARLMNSGSGFSSGGGTSGYDIIAGFSGAGGDGWPNDVQPSILATPDQGQMNSYPVSNTGTD